MQQTNSSRREKLIAWRKTTGRTPMKRLSYVQEFYQGSPQTVTTTIHVHPTIQAHIQSSCAGRKSFSKPANKVGRRENICLKTPKTAVVLCQQSSQHSQKKLTRREMLDQWLAIHGSTVKRPRSVLKSNTSLNQRGARTEGRRNQPRDTFNGLSCLERVRESRCPYSPSTMKRLKEDFQRDIDETVAELQELETDPRQGCVGDIARELDFSEGEHCAHYSPPTAAHKMRTRRSLAHDPALMFHSSTIRYSLALSEPRRKLKRRHTMSLSSPERKRQIFLTPVRRSTRKNRHCPGLSLDQELCVDSPGQLAGNEAYSDAQVEIVPNNALMFDDQCD